MKIIFWGGILFFIGSVFLMLRSFEEYRVGKYGDLVNARIEKLPGSCLGTRIKHYGTFSYNGETYIKQIPAGYCDEHKVGETIDMKYLEGYSMVLFPNESGMQLVSTIILGLFGVFSILYTYKKKRSTEKVKSIR